jgi:hypothetical protein
LKKIEFVRDKKKPHGVCRENRYSCPENHHFSQSVSLKRISSIELEKNTAKDKKMGKIFPIHGE